jgi:hypothetical protein
LSTNKPKSQPVATNRRPGLYANVDPEIREIFDWEAEKRHRSLGSLLYIILFNATDGFTDFSIADRPLNQEEVTTT